MKKFIFILILIPFTSSIFAQELDESYLESLPEEIRDDLKRKAKERDEDFEKPTYRRQSSTIDKKAMDKDQDMFDPDEEDDKKKKELNKVYGEDFFNTIQTSFMPVTEPNFDPSYILDFGDQIELEPIGQKNSKQKFKINRDGSIVLAEIGKINLSGMTLSEATNYIKAVVAKKYIGTEAF